MARKKSSKLKTRKRGREDGEVEEDDRDEDDDDKVGSNFFLISKIFNLPITQLTPFEEKKTEMEYCVRLVFKLQCLFLSSKHTIKCVFSYPVLVAFSVATTLACVLRGPGIESRFFLVHSLFIFSCF